MPAAPAARVCLRGGLEYFSSSAVDCAVFYGALERIRQGRQGRHSRSPAEGESHAWRQAQGGSHLLVQGNGCGHDLAPVGAVAPYDGACGTCACDASGASGAHGASSASGDGGGEQSAATVPQWQRQVKPGAWFDLSFGDSSDNASALGDDSTAEVFDLSDSAWAADFPPPAPLCAALAVGHPGRPPDALECDSGAIASDDSSAGGHPGRPPEDDDGGVSDTTAVSTASSWCRDRTTIKKEKKSQLAAKKRAAREALRVPCEPDWPPEVRPAVDRRCASIGCSRVCPEAVRFFTSRAEELFFELALSPCALQWWHTAAAASPSSKAVLVERFGKLLVGSLLRHRSR